MKIQKLTILTSAILLTLPSMASENMLSKMPTHNEVDHSHHEIVHSTKINDSNNKIDTEKTYICPMHPEVMSDEEGKCPICGMKLKEVIFEEE